jgi:hypothetical protein
MSKNKKQKRDRKRNEYSNKKKIVFIMANVLNVLYAWKVQLRRIFMVDALKNEFTASVSTAGKKTLRNREIAHIMKEMGVEGKVEYIEHILEQADGVVREYVKRGHSVLTGCAQFTPRVQGVWESATANYDPAKHRIGLHIIPSAEMREALRAVSLEVLGVKPDGAVIGLVTDTSTGLADGNMVSGDVISITDNKIKIAPDNDASMGVFFIDADEKVIPVTHRLIQNDNAKVIVQVPTLPAGQYILRIVTRFSSSSILLKEPRVVEYDRPLVVN